MTLKHLKQHQNSTCCHQKFSLSPSQKEVKDCDCFLNHFEDLPSEHLSAPFMSKRNSFDQHDFSPKSEKFLQTEGGRAASNHPEVPSRICKSQESPKLVFKDFVQLMICKYLLDENQQMKAQLDIKTNPLKEKYENNLSLMLKKALGKQFDMSDDS